VRAAISIPLAVLFLLLATFNVWSMISSHSGSKLPARWWALLHRAAGYAFVSLFAIFSYFMLLRLKGWPDEISPRIVLHMALAFSLAPLLVAKIIAVRSRKASHALLCALGIAIYAVAFTLVTINIAVHFLRVASVEKTPFWISSFFVFAVLLLAGFALASRQKVRQPHSNSGAASTEEQGSRNSAPRRDSLTLTLARKERQSQDAHVLRFLLPAGTRLEARPGQFLTFEWFIEGKAVHRSYSICSSPTQSAYLEIMPKRMQNGCVSQFLNDNAAPGLMVKARGPYGQFYFDQNKHDRIVLIAGGSGITPMMSILRYLHDMCIACPCTLIYCIRSENDLAFHAELRALADQISSFRYVPVVSKGGPDWKGWKGRLRREILEAEIKKPLESTYFLCGPVGFMDLGRALLEEMSVQPAQILQESFGDDAAKAQGQPSGPNRVNVTFARSALSISSSPELTLLETAEANGVPMPFGCRQGNCGTCMTRLLQGSVQMFRHEALDDELRSEGFVLPCVSRPLNDITLDA
jgi:ferredoxin-NADP reductase